MMPGAILSEPLPDRSHEQARREARQHLEAALGARELLLRLDCHDLLEVLDLERLDERLAELSESEAA